MPKPQLSLQQFDEKLQAFADIHRHNETQQFITNIDAEITVIAVEGVRVPVSVNHELSRKNAWICSPITTYCDYALEELKQFPWLPFKSLLTRMANTAGRVMHRLQLDDAVMVNNWLVTTNSYPHITPMQYTALVEKLKQRWPKKSLWFRSLNDRHHHVELEMLKQLGAILVPSRQVYLCDDVAVDSLPHADIKKDFRLLDKRGAEKLDVERTTQQDYQRMQWLYEQLYLEKYSRLNPAYTAEFMRAWHRAGLLEFYGFRNQSGTLEAMIGIFRLGNIITCPLLGYDTNLPSKTGLYRLLCAVSFRYALEQDCVLNLSAGAAHFKRQRGAQPAIEYSAVFVPQQKTRQRVWIGLLSMVCRRLLVPMMRRYRL